MAVVGKVQLRLHSSPTQRTQNAGSPKLILVVAALRWCQCEKPLVRKQKNRRKKARFIKALMAIKITREARQLLERRSARASRFLDGISIVGDNSESDSCEAQGKYMRDCSTVDESTGANYRR